MIVSTTLRYNVARYQFFKLLLYYFNKNYNFMKSPIIFFDSSSKINVNLPNNTSRHITMKAKPRRTLAEVII